MRVEITPHFVERWHETLGYSTIGKIKARLMYALRNQTIYGKGDGFTVSVGRYDAVCFIDACGAWVFVTVLREGMELKGRGKGDGEQRSLSDRAGHIGV